MRSVARRQVLKGGLALAVLSTNRAIGAPVVTPFDPAFDQVAAPDARSTTLYRDGRWCEGLCWDTARGGLVFSDTRLNRLSLLKPDTSVEILRDPSDNANGNCLDRQGRLVTCQHRTRRVVREEADGRLTVLADGFEGKRLNSPNDVVLAPDGALWFTDPVFGIRQPDEGVMAEPEQAARRIYRIAPDGGVEARIDRLDQPNGIAFSPDGRTLYVSDAGAGLNPEGGNHIWRFEVDADGSVRSGAPMARPPSGVADGMKVDRDGRLYAACEDGVRVFAPDGKLLGRIATPSAAANVEFGGPEGRRLFIAAGSSIHAVDLRVSGLSTDRS